MVRSVAPPPEPRRAFAAALAAAALAAFIALAFGDLLTSSPTSDETAHLVAGYSVLVTHDYRLNPEHPPLTKIVAALPLLGMRVWPAGFRDPDGGVQAFALFREAWAMAIANPSFTEWRVAQLLLYGLRDSVLQRLGADPLDAPTTVAYARGDFLNDAEAMFRRARTAMLLFGVALAVLIFCWSYELWGMWGAALSLLLYCADPNFIAHSVLVTNDVATALFFFATAYAFWRFCRRPSIGRGSLFALSFALSQSVKFSAALLAPIVVVMGVWELVRDRRRARPIVAAIAAAAVASVAVIWAVYGFRYSTAPDPGAARAEEIAARGALRQAVLNAPNVWPSGHFDIRGEIERWTAMETLAKQSPDNATDAEVRRAMRTSRPSLTARLLLFAADHKLLPEAYLFGFASAGAGSQLRSSYLDGRYSNTGFPDFFLWTTLYKTPVSLIAISAAGVLFAVRRRPDRLAFLLLPALIYGWFAVTSRLHIGHRHVLPVLPFVYALAGAGASWWLARGRRRTALAIVGIGLLALGPVVVLLPRPCVVLNQHLAYINELAGGPRAGALKLSDSNFDWGQDLKRLGAWLSSTGVKDPIDLVYFGNADPRSYGIRYYNLRTPDFPPPHAPGLFAISQVDYLGIQFDSQHRRGYWDALLAKHGAQRIETPFYSIFVYRLARP